MVEKGETGGTCNIMLTKNYETIYICGQIKAVIGRRYNIRPDLDENTKPELSGLLYPEVTAGLFRAMVLDEMHYDILKKLNELQVADIKQISQATEIKTEILTRLLYECVVYGLACENLIQIADGSTITLYFVDTGGIFALKDGGLNYKVLPFTTCIDERLRIYRKNIFFMNSAKDRKEKTVKFLEEFTNPEEFALTISEVVLLFDSEISLRAEVAEEVGKICTAIKKKNLFTKFYNLAKKDYSLL